MEDNKITKEMAKEFWRDLMGSLWGDANCKTTHGIMSAKLISNILSVPEEKAEAFLWACVGYGITDRQGGGFVV